MSRVETGPGWELRLGRWQDVLTDVTECDAVITDPPYGERTHTKQRHGRRPGETTAAGDWVSARGLGYAHISPADAAEIAHRWGTSVRSWFCAMCSHDLVPGYEAGVDGAGLTRFAPLPLVMRGMNVRLAGDGPSSWSVFMLVARTKAAHRWGTLPGAYVGNPFDAGENKTACHRTTIVGSKPRWLMRAIVRDYSRPGDLIVDPYAGGATTLLAAVTEGRRAIGAEVDPETFEKAVARLRKGHTPDMFSG